MLVAFHHTVGYRPMGDYFDGTIVNFQLFVADLIGGMVMQFAVNAGNALYEGGNGTNVVAYQHYGHFLIQGMQQLVQFLFETIVYMGFRFIQDQQGG